MRKIRLIRKILRDTGADRILLGFLGFMLLSALVIWLCESGIHTYREALWYCFAVVSTIGFGDVVVHTFVSRVFSVLLSVYAVAAIAIFTAVIVNYFTKLIELRQKESIGAFVDKLERLPELSKAELAELSEQVRKYRPPKN